MVILTLMTGAYLALSGRREVLGGLFLGAAVSLKFLGWPMLLFYAWKRRWHVVFGAAAAMLLTHIACFLVMPGAVSKYYTTVVPGASEGYSANDLNISIWTLGQRCFGGLHSQALVNAVNAPPWFDRPGLASSAGVVVALAVLLISLRAAVKLPDQGDAFLLMLSVSTILNPIAWHIYLTLLLLPLAVVARRLAQQSWPLRGTVAYGCLISMRIVFLRLPRDLVIGEGTGLNVSALRALVTALPLLWPLATAWAVVRSTRNP